MLNILAQPPQTEKTARGIVIPRYIKLTQVSAFCFVVRNGMLLVGETSTGYSAPGGKMEEQDKTPYKAAMRELKDEVGTKVDVTLSDSFVKPVFTRPQGGVVDPPTAGEKVELKLYLFCQGGRGKPRQVSEEMKNPRYVPFGKELMQLDLRPSLREVVEWYTGLKSCWKEDLTRSSLQSTGVNNISLANLLSANKVNPKTIRDLTGIQR